MKKLALFVAVLAALSAAFALGQRYASRDVHVVESPDHSRVAVVTERRCGGTVCQTLWAGSTRTEAARLGTLPDGRRVDEVIWTPDGARVAFLVDGVQLRFYDPATGSPAGQLALIASGPAERLARGVTFSENGRAITFDDCPRGRSGCRAGLVATPQ